MDQGEYSTFISQGPPPAGTIYFDKPNATTGSFSVNLPQPGNYYILFMHGAGNEASSQEGRLSFQLEAITPSNLVIGLTSLVIGVVFVTVSLLSKRKIELKRRTWYTTALVAFLPGLLVLEVPPFAVPWTTVAIWMILLMVPILLWYFVGKRIAPVRLLLSAIIRTNKSSGFKYFFDKPHGPGMLQKTLELTLTTFGISAFAVQRLVGLSSATSSQDITSFIGYFILFLTVVFVVFFPLWTFEASGLRCHDQSKSTVSVPGALVGEALKDFGGLFAFAFFALDIESGSIAQATRLMLGLLIYFVPVCLLAIVIFRYEIEPRLVAKFERTGMPEALGHHKIWVVRQEEKSETQPRHILNPVQVTSYTINARFCGACRTPLRQGERFCGGCGKLIET